MWMYGEGSSAEEKEPAFSEGSTTENLTVLSGAGELFDGHFNLCVFHPLAWHSREQYRATEQPAHKNLPGAEHCSHTRFVEEAEDMMLSLTNFLMKGRVVLLRVCCNSFEDSSALPSSYKGLPQFPQIIPPCVS